jgi:uncharacterized protein YutE (UPF0331/DUF86 family)
MVDDVLVNKAAAIERAVRRVREEYAGDPRCLLDNQTLQDAIILNLQRACESSIDAAMHLVRLHRLGVPQETREAFAMLEQAHRLDARLADRFKKMVGFLNVAIHDYQWRAAITLRVSTSSDASATRLTRAASQMKRSHTSRKIPVPETASS